MIRNWTYKFSILLLIQKQKGLHVTIELEFLKGWKQSEIRILSLGGTDQHMILCPRPENYLLRGKCEMGKFYNIKEIRQIKRISTTENVYHN